MYDCGHSKEVESGIFLKRMDLKRFVVRFALLQEPFRLTWRNHIDEESSCNKEFAHANIRVFVPLITPIIQIVENRICFSTTPYNTYICDVYNVHVCIRTTVYD